MPAYLNHVTLSHPVVYPTLYHTINPASSGTVVAGSRFTPTAGRLLVCFGIGPQPGDTPSGWTNPPDAQMYDNSFVTMFYRVAAGSDTWNIDHEGYGEKYLVDIYEFPQGSTYFDSIASSDANSVAQTLTGLTGTKTVISIANVNNTLTSGSIDYTWTGTGTELVDVYQLQTGGNIGWAYSVSYADRVTASSATFTPTASAGSLFQKITAAFTTGNPVGGSVAAAGVLKRATTRHAAGSSTAVGTARKVTRPGTLTGSVTPSSSLGRARRMTLTGSFTAAGLMTTARTVLKPLTAALTATGAIRRGPAKNPAGTVTAAGLIKPRNIQLRPRAVIDITGDPLRRIKRFVGGTVTPAAAVGTIVIRFRTLVSSLTPTGAARKGVTRHAAGTVTPTAPILRRITLKPLAAVITATSTLIRGVLVRVFGRAGTATVTVATATEMDLVFYERHRAQLSVTVVAESDITI